MLIMEMKWIEEWSDSGISSAYLLRANKSINAAINRQIFIQFTAAETRKIADFTEYQAPPLCPWT